jgi:hypothetical protein
MHEKPPTNSDDSNIFMTSASQRNQCYLNYEPATAVKIFKDITCFPAFGSALDFPCKKITPQFNHFLLIKPTYKWEAITPCNYGNYDAERETLNIGGQSPESMPILII